MKCEFGFCSVCEKEIAPKDANGVRRASGDYTEVQVEWKNGSRMNIGVCVKCATTHSWATSEAKKGLTKAHQEHWTSKGGTFDPEIVIV